MGYFPSARATDLKNHTVRCVLLVMFDFASGPVRLWQGWGELKTLDDNVWGGIGKLGQIGDLESTIAGTASETTFTLSGVDPALLAEAMDTSEEIYGRDVNVYMQFFDEAMNCLDNPYVVWAGTMDVMTVKHTVNVCQVSLSAQSIFFRRHRPPLGNLSDEDQRRFYPDDHGLAIMPGMVSRTVLWPVIAPQP